MSVVSLKCALKRWLVILWVAMCCIACAGRMDAQAPPSKSGGGLQVLSDTQGVNFSPYLRNVQRVVYKQWIALLPKKTTAPTLAEGETYIVFSILPDGKIGSMKLEASTHDIELDRAAWRAIVGAGQYEPLPTEFHGPELKLRFHFLVNKSVPPTTP